HRSGGAYDSIHESSVSIPANYWTSHAQQHRAGVCFGERTECCATWLDSQRGTRSRCIFRGPRFGFRIRTALEPLCTASILARLFFGTCIFRVERNVNWNPGYEPESAYRATAPGRRNTVAASPKSLFRTNSSVLVSRRGNNFARAVVKGVPAVHDRQLVP